MEQREWWTEVDEGTPAKLWAATPQQAAEYATQTHIENHGGTAWNEEEHEVAVWMAGDTTAVIAHFTVVVHVSWSFSAHEHEREDEEPTYSASFDLRAPAPPPPPATDQEDTDA